MTLVPPVPPELTPLSAAAVPQRRADSERVRTLQWRLNEAAAQATGRSDLMVRLARTLTDTARADIVVIARPDAQGQVALDGILHPMAGLPEPTTASFREYALTSCRERETRVGRIGRPPTQLLICVPIPSASSPEALLALFLAPSTTPDMLTMVVELVVATVTHFDLRLGAIGLDREVAATAAVVDLAARVQSAASVDSAGQTLCDDAARHLNVLQMAVGLTGVGESKCRLTAVSRGDGSVSPEHRESFLEAALDECLLRGETGVWPAPAGAGPSSRPGAVCPVRRARPFGW